MIRHFHIFFKFKQVLKSLLNLAITKSKKNFRHIGLTQTYLCFNFVLFFTEKPIKYNEVPRDKLRSLMPEGVAQAFDYMVEGGKQAAPFNDDVKKLTGQHGTFEQFIRDHKDFINS